MPLNYPPHPLGDNSSEDRTIKVNGEEPSTGSETKVDNIVPWTPGLCKEMPSQGVSENYVAPEKSNPVGVKVDTEDGKNCQVEKKSGKKDSCGRIGGPIG